MILKNDIKQLERQAMNFSSARPRMAMLVHAYYLKDARVRRYAEALVSEGIETDVYCLQEEGEPLHANHGAVEIIRVPYTRKRGGKASYYLEYATTLALLGARLTVRHLRRPYSVVHVHTPPDVLIYAAIVTRITGAKIILDFHDLMPELYMAKYRLPRANAQVRVLQAMERHSASIADVVLTACTAFRDNLVLRQVPQTKVQIIRNLPDPKLFEQHKGRVKEEDTYFTLLYIGSLSERYDVALAIRAMDRLRSMIPKVKLRIVGKITGEGTYKDFLQALVRDQGLSKIVEFGAPVPLDSVAAEIVNCDVGIYTPIHDIHMDNAFSLKAGEFAAMGVPMVTTLTPVMEETLGPMGAAYIEAGDMDDFVKKVFRLYSDPEYRRGIIAAEEQFTRANHWDQEKLLYLSVVGNLLSGSGAPASHRSIRGFAKRASRLLLTRAHRTCRKIFPGQTSTRHVGVRILTYHDVGAGSDNEWCVSPRKFEEQMRFLSDHCPIATLSDIQAWLGGERELADGTIAVTFDDGLLGIYEHAMSSLQRHGISSTVFVVEENLLRGKTLSGRHTLSADHIRAMARVGVLVGSHSRSHVSLGATGWDSNRLSSETLGSKHELERILSMPIRYFAYPYGTQRDVNPDAVAATRDAGYELALTSIHGKISRGADPLQLNRVKIESGDSTGDFPGNIARGMDQWALVDKYGTWLQSRN